MRVRRAARVDELDEPLSVDLPRAIWPARDRAQVEDAEDLADLRGPGGELMRENILRVPQVGWREGDLERHRRRTGGTGVHIDSTCSLREVLP